MAEKPSWEQVREVFETAEELPPEERAAYLDEICGEDRALRKEVESLLAASDTRFPWLEGPALEVAAEWLSEGSEAPSPPKPERLGPWRLLDALGRGGMGEVYLAERVEGGYQTLAAAKLLRSELESEDMRRRFDQERQILASLEHASIARLLDGGVDDGRPYLVMERVEGLPIDEYCERGNLGLEERLRLFIKVCAAVQHAHRHLVVHSDLKPGNILVTAEGEPKLLDFGVARLLGHESVPRAATTVGDGLRLMTPEYASPEQVRGEALTTATDIYSLGVLLYRLLTGAPPYRLASRARREVERVICEEEPEKPSTAVERLLREPPSAATSRDPGSETATSEPTPSEATETVGEESPETTRPHRWAGTERLRRQLRGDLDTITLMALRKEPERRYASVEQFAEDLRRYGEGLPVLARKDTPAYRAAKFLRRHRWGVLATALVAFSLLVGALLALWQAERAKEEARKAATALAFLEQTFRGIDPTFGQDPRLTLRDFLEDAATQVDALDDQPEVKARLLHILGEGFRNLGLRTEARDFLERALTLRRELFGDAAHPQIAQTLDRLGLLAFDEGKLDEAEKRIDEALAMQLEVFGEHHVETARVLNSQGRLLLVQGQWTQAEATFGRTLELRQDLLGPEHRDTGLSRNNLGIALEQTGSPEKVEKAIALHRENLEIHLRRFGAANLLVANIHNSLGSALATAGRDEEAAEQYTEALEIFREIFGADHPRLAGPLHNLADLLWQREAERALALVKEATRLIEGQEPQDPVALAKHLVLRGMILHALERRKEAEGDIRRGLALRLESLGPSRRDTAEALYTLATVLEAAGRLERAVEPAQELLRAWGENEPPAAQDEPYTQALLGKALLAAGREEEARRWLEQGHAGLLRIGREDLIEWLGLDEVLEKVEDPP